MVLAYWSNDLEWMAVIICRHSNAHRLSDYFLYLCLVDFWVWAGTKKYETRHYHSFEFAKIIGPLATPGLLQTKIFFLFCSQDHRRKPWCARRDLKSRLLISRLAA